MNEQLQSDQNNYADGNRDNCNALNMELAAEETDPVPGDDARERLGVRAEDKKRQILKKIGHADGGNQNGKRRGCVPQRSVGDSLCRNAEQRAENNRRDHAQHRRTAPGRGDGENNVTTYHNKVAMRKIQHLGNAVNHGVAKRDDGIDTAQTKSADQCCQKAHALSPCNIP